jgi:hypothetical protein
MAREKPGSKRRKSLPTSSSGAGKSSKAPAARSSLDRGKHRKLKPKLKERPKSPEPAALEGESKPETSALFHLVTVIDGVSEVTSHSDLDKVKAKLRSALLAISDGAADVFFFCCLGDRVLISRQAPLSILNPVTGEWETAVPTDGPPEASVDGYFDTMGGMTTS